MHRQASRVELFSRDLKETTAAFPELTEAAPSLGHDVLFDGEVLAHRDGRVLRFFELQRRLGRKKVDADLRRDVPVVLVIFDLLWLDGRTLLDEPLTERRKLLESLGLEHPYLLARLEEATDPEHLDRIFAETRVRGNEGLMVKDPLSPYTPGRRGLAWLKLKRPLATLDVVVTAVEWGHGKRKGVLSDYTFAVKDTQTGRLVNVGNRVFFIGADPNNGYELWTSDGTAAGTRLVQVEGEWTCPVNGAERLRSWLERAYDRTPEANARH